MSGLNRLAEALLRVEHKIDALLRSQKVVAQPMHFVGLGCPVCGMPVDYEIDIEHQVVVRKCDCRTGKVPSSFPLVTGVSDAARVAKPSAPQDRHQREDR